MQKKAKNQQKVVIYVKSGFEPWRWHCVLFLGKTLSVIVPGRPVDLATKNSFPLFFVRKKGMAYILKSINYFSILYFSFATSQNSILADQGLATVIERVKTDPHRSSVNISLIISCCLGSEPAQDRTGESCGNRVQCGRPKQKRFNKLRYRLFQCGR